VGCPVFGSRFLVVPSFALFDTCAPYSSFDSPGREARILDGSGRLIGFMGPSFIFLEYGSPLRTGHSPSSSSSRRHTHCLACGGSIRPRPPLRSTIYWKRTFPPDDCFLPDVVDGFSIPLVGAK